MSLLAVLIASLLGSAHCAGMCGGFVACYSGAQKKSFWPDVTYNAGRLFVYMGLGCIAGYFGAFVDDAGLLLGVQRVSTIIMGALLIVWGVKGILWPSSVSALDPSQSALYRVVQPLFAKVLKGDISLGKDSWTLRAFLLGTLSTFLPCAWLYSFVAVAAASGSSLQGALIMTAFWLGTLPALVSFSVVSRVLGSSFRARVPILTSVLLTLAGVFALFGKVGVIEMHHHGHGEHGQHGHMDTESHHHESHQSIPARKHPSNSHHSH